MTSRGGKKLKRKTSEAKNTSKWHPLMYRTMDSVVIGSGIFDKRDLAALSEVCHHFHASVRARTLEISGSPELLANISEFPGARSLTVTFNTKYFCGNTWQMPGNFSAYRTNLSSINDLQIKVYEPKSIDKSVSAGSFLQCTLY